MKILILGGSGKLGKVIVSTLLLKKYELVLFARNPQKIKVKNKNINILKGNVVNSEELAKALTDVDVVVSVLGHGFRSKYPILKENLEELIPLMEKKKIKRFITVTGAALKTKEDKNSITLTFTEEILGLIDPYRLNDSKFQQKLLEKSNINWTVVRTPIHKNGEVEKLKSIGYKQPLPWRRIPRKSVANFILKCIEDEIWIKKSPIIY